MKTFVKYFYIKLAATRGDSKGGTPFVVQEGLGTRSKGFPTVLSPISVRTEMGCLRGMSASRATDSRGRLSLHFSIIAYKSSFS